MSTTPSATTTHQPVRVGETITGLLCVAAGALVATYGRWPGLLRWVPIVAVTYAFLSVLMWRAARSGDEPVSTGAYIGGPMFLGLTAVLVLTWPAFPYEIAVTFICVAAMSAAWTVNVFCAIRHQNNKRLNNACR